LAGGDANIPAHFFADAWELTSSPRSQQLVQALMPFGSRETISSVAMGNSRIENSPWAWPEAALTRVPSTTWSDSGKPINYFGAPRVWLDSRRATNHVLFYHNNLSTSYINIKKQDEKYFVQKNECTFLRTRTNLDHCYFVQEVV
jgi:hypothetical protein